MIHLKIENQTLNEKIEERNEDLHKLRKKTTTTVQVLTHIKEKLQFCIGEIEIFEDIIKKSKLPIVVKADGLAAGKGVTICQSKKQVLKSTNEIFNGRFLLCRRSSSCNKASA